MVLSATADALPGAGLPGAASDAPPNKMEAAKTKIVTSIAFFMAFLWLYGVWRYIANWMLSTEKEGRFLF